MRRLAALPVIAALPLLPWLVGRVLDAGALSIACALAGVALVVSGARAASAAPSAHPLALCALTAGVLVGVCGLSLSSRALLVGGAVLTSAGILALRGGTAPHVVVPGGALVALAAIHPADIDALIGWPLRALLASGAASALALFGGTPVAAETVLLVEGRVADVEAACSGTRSFTALALALALLIGARAGARPRIGRMAMALAAASLVLIALSIVRVAAIAGLALAADAPALADVVHVPLGLFALLGSVAVAHAVLSQELSGGPTEGPLPRAAAALAVSCAVTSSLIVVAGVAGPDRPRPASTAIIAPVEGLELPLMAGEVALYDELGAVAFKRALPGGGSVLVAAGPRRAHHAPERCLAAGGVRVEAATTTEIAGVPIRRLSLAREGARFTGLSFFASRERVVASALERSLRDVVLGEGPWVFVSILTPLHADEPALVRTWIEAARTQLGAES